MNLHNLYKKQVEAWKERFDTRYTDSSVDLRYKGDRDNIKSFISSSRHKDTIELLEAEIERKKGMREELINSPVRSEDYTRALNYKTMGYNSAIDEDIAYLEENLQKIKKEL